MSLTGGWAKMSKIKSKIQAKTHVGRSHTDTTLNDADAEVKICLILVDDIDFKEG
jgi:hypothetical protein